MPIEIISSSASDCYHYYEGIINAIFTVGCVATVNFEDDFVMRSSGMFVEPVNVFHFPSAQRVYIQNICILGNIFLLAINANSLINE